MKPHDPHDAYRLDAFLVPAGGVSIAPGDYARFLQLHLRGLQGRDGLLKAETIKRLHTPVEGKYAGSAGTFYAVVSVWPSRDLAVGVFANSGGDRAAKACGEILRAMARRFD